jgi:uncharacterized protein YjbI with pentapeptide repeats
MIPLANRCRFRPASCPHQIKDYGLCIFHIPKPSQKGKELMHPMKRQKADAIEFLFQVAFTELLNRTETDTSITEYNFRGFRFPPMRLEAKKFIKPVSFWGARFSGLANFQKATFEEKVDFHEARFYEEAFFPYASFKREAVFLDTVFYKSANFGDATFDTQPVFMKSVFNGYPTYFDSAVFNQGAQFVWVTFKGGCAFHRATFDQHTVFEGSYSNPDCFERVCEFDSLRLRNNATILFDHVDLSHVTFLDTDLERIKFRGVKWYYPSVRPWRKNALWDEFRPQVSERTYPHVAENYAQLVINYEKRRDYKTAEDFHIGEMEMRRKTAEAEARRHKWRKYYWWINIYRLYRFLSTYGTSYRRALWIFMLLFFICSWVFLFTGLQSTKENHSMIKYTLWPSLDFAAITQWIMDYLRACVFTFSIVTLQKQPPYEPVGVLSHVWVGFTSLLLAGQAALIFLAIRRQFKR